MGSDLKLPSLGELRQTAVPCTVEEAVAARALDYQVGGCHYKEMTIQPVEFIHANGLPYIEGAVIKYMCRWRERGGLEDLRKARHFIDLLIEFEAVRR